jgi:cytochrome c
MIACATVLAQAPTYDLGKTATPDEIQKWDIAIGPSGKELPPGSGTAKDGADVFAKKCAVCHGKAGEGTKLASQLITTNGKPPTIMGWPFATTIWDFINRAMPMNAEGSLSANEVYGLTAFLLAQNGAIQESVVLDAKALSKVDMPNRKRFTAPPTDWKPGTPRPFSTK